MPQNTIPLSRLRNRDQRIGAKGILGAEFVVSFFFFFFHIRCPTLCACFDWIARSLIAGVHLDRQCEVSQRAGNAFDLNVVKWPGRE